MTVAEILQAAIDDFEEHGFDDEERLIKWTTLLREAIQLQVRSAASLEQQVKDHLQSIYDRVVQRGSVIRMHQGVDRFTLQRIKPRLHAELTRRIMASASLIKLNRVQMVEKTLQRFSGWATSQPVGGSALIDRRKLKEEISQPIRKLPFVERRLLIDQGHKLNSSISAVVASDGGAIAARWFSHYRESGYDYREDHRDRDGKIFLLRGTWATKAGYVKPGKAGWADEVTQPAEEVYCRCRWTYQYHLRQLPDDMLTEKGREALAKVRAA